MRGKVRERKGMLENARECAGFFGNAPELQEMRGNVRECAGMPGIAQESQGMCGNVQECLNDGNHSSIAPPLSLSSTYEHIKETG